MSKNKGPRDDRWYFPLMAPNTKGEKFAWLDPTSIYINEEAFSDLLDDLCEPFSRHDCDLVAGLDAMGFVLGSAIATRLEKGFLPIRKAGKLCVETDKVPFKNYSGRLQELEIRKPAFRPETRVLLVDQWIETGGTMGGAIELVQRQGGSIAGIVAIVIEENKRTKSYRAKYKCVSAIIPETEWQRQANGQCFKSFNSYTPELAFPPLSRSESI
ncbi:MAG: adenine phosphoribosyltransferase [Magnetovibrio sp.]|nr:adenine phosphoribosyltransferase [Magnetovibrio sp.]